MQVKQRGREPWIQTGYRSHDQNFENIVVDSCANFRVCPFVAFHARSRKPRRSGIHSVKFSKWRTLGTMRTAARSTSPNFPNLNCKESVQNIDNNFLDDIFMYHTYFNNALGIQHRNFSIAIVLIFVRMTYVNVIATGIVFNIRATSSHIGLMMAFSEHRRSIIRVFDRRSIMNRLYWNNQQVVHLCFVPFVWEQRGVIAAGTDQTAMISHLLAMSWASRRWSWGHVGAVWEPRIDRVKLAFAV